MFDSYLNVKNVNIWLAWFEWKWLYLKNAIIDAYIHLCSDISNISTVPENEPTQEWEPENVAATEQESLSISQGKSWP